MIRTILSLCSERYRLRQLRRESYAADMPVQCHGTRHTPATHPLRPGYIRRCDERERIESAGEVRE